MRFDGGKEILYFPCMLPTSTLTRKNQTTLPKAVVSALGLKASDQLVYEIEPGQVVVRARTGSLADFLVTPPAGPTPKRPFTLEEIHEAIAESAAGKRLGGPESK